MDNLNFSVNEAIQYGNNGNIEQWVHLFLNSVGNNAPFSEGLRLQKRYWLGPVLIDLDDIYRCCGPEDDIKFFEPKINWEKRVSHLSQMIKDGWNMPPLIVNHSDGYLEINDGNHRHEALKRAGVQKFWVILWDSDHPDHLLPYSEKLTIAEVSELLKDLMGNQVHEIEPAGRGYVKDVYFFEHENTQYVISFSKESRHVHVKSQIVQCLKKTTVSMNTTLTWGTYKSLTYEVTKRIKGDSLRGLSKAELEPLVPEVIRYITQVHFSSISHTSGYGWIQKNGQGEYKSWHSFLEGFFAKEQDGFWTNWYDLFDNSFLKRDTFDALYKEMMSLSKYCEGQRFIVHGDFHLGNILYNKKISGLIDWDNALYGDFLFDVALLQMQNPELEIAELFKAYYTSEGISVPHFKERFRCVALCKGLDAMRFACKMGWKESYESVVAYLTCN